MTLWKRLKKKGGLIWQEATPLSPFRWDPIQALDEILLSSIGSTHIHTRNE